MYNTYLFRPLKHNLDISSPSLNQPFPYAAWPTQNVEIWQKSINRRPGYIADVNLGEGVEIQRIIHYQNSAGATATVFLTDTNACVRESSSAFSYITEEYTTGTANVTDGSLDEVVGTGTNWDADIAAGDYFIMDDDWASSADENDSDWTKIESITDDTNLVLSGAYTGATITDGNYTVRKVYTVPVNERWTWCMVNDDLVFTNGNTNAQYWNHTTNTMAQAVDSTYSTRARYCIEYANRLVEADLYISGTRQIYTVSWSKEGDITDHTDSTAGTADMDDSEDIITGLGKVGGSLVIYKSDSLVFGNRTGSATAPIIFPDHKKGVGCVAPYSIIHALGTNVFIGRDNFYAIESQTAVPIGDPIKDKFFSLINETEVTKVFGYNNILRRQLRWFVTDKDNIRRCFVCDYNHRPFEWGHFIYYHDFSSAGKGEV